MSSLPPDLEQFVQSQLSQGKYQSAADVVCDAVRLLREREERLEALRAEVDQGLAQIERGEAIELDSDEAIEAFFAGVERRGIERLKSAKDDA